MFEQDINCDVVQWFFNNSVNLDRRCAVDKTVLSYAMEGAPLSIIALLIAHVPDQRPCCGELLHAAGDHAELLESLLQCISYQVNDLSWRNDPYSRCFLQVVGAGTPLHFAAVNGNHQAAAILLAAGASPTILDDNGDTPIDIARRNGYAALLGILLEARKAELQPPKSLM
jgi:hypothetical protein